MQILMAPLLWDRVQEPFLSKSLIFSVPEKGPGDEDFLAKLFS
jgi:hypothetical protein